MTERKTICSARSTKNGIIFYSNLIPYCGTETFIDENGNICNRPVIHTPDQVPDSLIPLDYKSNALREKRRILLDLMLILLSVILAFTFGNVGLLSAAICFCLTTSSLFYDFVESCHKIGIRDDNGYSLKRFHGAEHMAINAYDKLRRIPTLEELRSFSRFRKNCRSRAIFKKLSVNLLYVLLIVVQGYIDSILLSIFLLFGLLILIDVIISYSSDKGWLRFLQVFVTEKPSDKELLLAIEALKNFEEMEEEFEQMNKSIVDIGILGGTIIFGLPEDY